MLTWQFWPFETSEYSVFLWPDNAPPFNPHERGGVPPDQLHTGSMTLHGPDLTVPVRSCLPPGFPRGSGWNWSRSGISGISSSF